MAHKVKIISYVQKGTAGFSRILEVFLQTAKAMSLRWEGSVISLTDVVYKTELACIWFVRAGRDLRGLFEVIKTRRKIFQENQEKYEKNI